MKNTSIITLKDLDRIKNTIVPKQNESEIRKSYDIRLKQINSRKMKILAKFIRKQRKSKIRISKT